ncbi:MAG: hypothetical protein K2O36_03720 [Ruminococcus sp.]|nr:hypothetical protein [Ruminococcus sp.]
MLQVGDIVKVVNNGKTYTTYCKFFRVYNIENYLNFYTWYKVGEDISKCAEIDLPPNGSKYEVQYIAKHHRYNDKTLVVISTLDYDEVFLIGIAGIEKVNEE